MSTNSTDDGAGIERYDQSEQAFAQLVCDTLEQRGLPEVAGWAWENHKDSRALGPVEVADEEGVPAKVPETGSNDPFAASKVADAIEAEAADPRRLFDTHQQEAGDGA